MHAWVDGACWVHITWIAYCGTSLQVYLPIHFAKGPWIPDYDVRRERVREREREKEKERVLPRRCGLPGREGLSYEKGPLDLLAVHPPPHDVPKKERGLDWTLPWALGTYRVSYEGLWFREE